MALLFLLPACLFLAFFSLYPMARIVALSFARYNPLGTSAWIGLANYARLWRDPDFWRCLGNSLAYLAVTPTLLAASLLVAALLRERLRGREAFRALYFLPVITPPVVVGIAWRWIFNEDVGLLNYLALALHLSSRKLPWLTSYPRDLISAMLVTVWQGVGYYMVMFLAGLTAIPAEVEEAATLDGASWLQRTLYITMPLLKPSIVLVSVLSSIAAVKVFTEVYVLLPGAPIAHKTLVVYLYQTAFERFELGYASALGVVLFAVTVLFSYVNLRSLEREGPAWHR